MSYISDMMYEQGYHDGYQKALSELNGKKFEKVTRCKDCRHCTFSDGEELADCMIKQGWFPVKPDWFCADGEMKEGDGE